MRNILRLFAACAVVASVAAPVSYAGAATLTATTMSRAGADLTALAVAADAAKTDKFLNDGASFIYINNGSGGTCTVTLTFGVGGIVDGVAPTNKTVAITNGHAVLIGPFPGGFYNDANGYMIWTYSTVTTVTVAVIKPGS